MTIRNRFIVVQYVFNPEFPVNVYAGNDRERAIKSLNFWDELGRTEGWEYLEDGTRIMLGTLGAVA
jgi:hypothetical protein